MEDFEHVFPRLYRRAYGVAFVVLGDRTEAEDVASEVTARALVRWTKVRSYAEPWTVRAAGNLAIDRVRRRERRLPARREQQHVVGPDADRIDLQRALVRLPRRQREVVVLRYLADLPEVAVAAALGCSTGTVKSHASRGLAALRLALTETP